MPRSDFIAAVTPTGAGLAELGFDWLSWDLAVLDEGFHRGVDRVAEALGAGTRLMWGIVPTTPWSSPGDPCPSRQVRYGCGETSSLLVHPSRC